MVVAAQRHVRTLLGPLVDDPDTWLERLPRVLGPDEPAGRVTAAAAEATGLPAGALVMCGAGDNMARRSVLASRPARCAQPTRPQPTRPQPTRPQGWRLTDSPATVIRVPGDVVPIRSTTGRRLSRMHPTGRLPQRAYSVLLTVFKWLPPVVRRTLVRAGTPGFTVGAVCAIVHEGSLLVLRQPHRPGWSLPGGLLNRGESAAQGVEREVLEETGLRVEVGLPLSVQVNGQVRRVDVVYRIHVDSRPHVTAGGEATEARWLPPGQVLDGADGPTREIMDLLARADDPGATEGRVLGRV